MGCLWTLEEIHFDGNDVIFTCFQLGKVLRVKKILKDKSQPAPSCMVFSSHERLLWGHIPELLESVKQDCLAQAYALHVMSQHLGANHVDGGVWFFSSLCPVIVVLIGNISIILDTWLSFTSRRNCRIMIISL